MLAVRRVFGLPRAGGKFQYRFVYGAGQEKTSRFKKHQHFATLCVFTLCDLCVKAFWTLESRSSLAVSRARVLNKIQMMICDESAQTVTYSPSWTLIPTHFCRNACGYCVFVAHEGAAAELIAPPQAAAEIARARRSGATELLIMSGEGVEVSQNIRASLRQYNFANYLDYLSQLAYQALSADLLPHINIGNLTEDELRVLRRHVPSMGMMLETTSVRLRRAPAHARAPDKTPARRLATLRAAGRARVPFTTGLLVGIGETIAERVETLRAIRAVHEKYGHIQEVIIQPFTPHDGTLMAAAPAPTATELCAVVAQAREILPPDVVVQIPPNLAGDFMPLVMAGARDLGGVSPDGDRINPAEHWREPHFYARVLAAHDFHLVPRLAVHDRFVSRRWLSAETYAACGRVRARLPQTKMNTATTDSGAASV